MAVRAGTEGKKLLPRRAVSEVHGRYLSSWVFGVVWCGVVLTMLLLLMTSLGWQEFSFFLFLPWTAK